MLYEKILQACWLYNEPCYNEIMMNAFLGFVVVRRAVISSCAILFSQIRIIVAFSSIRSQLRLDGVRLDNVAGRVFVH